MWEGARKDMPGRGREREADMEDSSIAVNRTWGRPEKAATGSVVGLALPFGKRRWPPGGADLRHLKRSAYICGN